MRSQGSWRPEGSGVRHWVPRRFGRSASQSGGATFTMILFLLLLVSSGLMYYYFQRSRLLERELTKWRAGEKPTAAEIATTGDGVSLAETARGIVDKVRDMPASTAIRKFTATTADDNSATELGGPAETSAGEPAADPAGKAKPVISEARPSPSPEAAAPGKVVEQEFAATQTPRPRAVVSEQGIEQKGYVPPKSPYTPQQQAARNGAQAADQGGTPRAAPGLRMAVPQRQSPKTRTQVAPHSNPGATDEIGSMLRSGASR